MKLPGPQSILGKILLVAIPPILVLGALLSTYAINARLDDLERALHSEGESDAREMASKAILGLFSGSDDLLAAACRNHLATSPGTDRVEVRDATGKLVASAERGPGAASAGDLVPHTAPVVLPTLDIGDEAIAATPRPVGEVTVYIDRGEALAAESRIIANALLITLAALLASILLAVLIGRQIVRPLTRLGEACSRLHNGQANVRVDETAEGEIGKLQKGFNIMASRVTASAETLQRGIDRATASLQRAMDEVELRNRELDIARQREHDANRCKSEFLANMSHEIRTPMNGVLGFISLLRKTPLDPRQQQFVATIERSGNNLMAIINDILDFSKVEAGRIEIEQVSFSLRDALDDVVGLLWPQAREKGLQVITTVDDSVPDTLRGDVTHLRQVLTNLLGNAIKFTMQGRITITVSAAVGDDGGVNLDVEVCDTGIGIAPDVMATLFDPFTQASASTKRLFGGSGLGLSICQSLVNAMGGRITARSEPNSGTCFTVLLPFTIDPGVTRPPAPCDAAGQPIHVMLVDPDDASREALRLQLEFEGLLVDSHAGPPTHLASVDAHLWLLSPAASTGYAATVEMTERLRAIADLPVCLARRSPQADPVGGPAGCCASLELPVSRQQLLHAVRTCARLPANAPLEPVVETGSDWLQGRRVLIADDNPINLQLVVALLRAHGAETMTAADGIEAVELAAARLPDLVILDIHMPRLDGFAAARRIRSSAALSTVPIIALTADTTAPDALGAGGAGFDAVLIKPVSELLLTTTIANCLQLAAPIAQDTTAIRPDPSEPGEVRDLAKAIATAGGSPETATALFDALLETLPDAIASIRSAFDRGEGETLRQALHKLKGSAAVCATPAFSALLARLEDAALHDDRAAIAGHLENLQHEADRLVAWRSTGADRPGPR